MTSYHILNGDALKEQFPPTLKGEFIILREALIEGPIQKENFFVARSKFITESYDVSQEDYEAKSKNELLKINNILNDSEVFLWFEDDLFCQCNLWYAVSSLIEKSSHLKIYLVRPDSDSWYGFGAMDHNRLSKAFENKILLQTKQLNAFNLLWELYLENKTKIPNKITQELSPIIPRIAEVIKAHTDRLSPNNRPYDSLKKIIDSNQDINFKTAFKTFTEVEGIYGYGDSSIKKMFDEIVKKN